MVRYIGRRLIALLPILFGITLVVFMLVHITPGDPARTYLGIHATDESLKALRHAWGLDQPIPLQYLIYLSGLVRGDLGQSLYYGTSVRSLIAGSLVPTLFLLLLSSLLAAFVSVILALIAATKPETLVDHTIRAIPTVGLAMPTFWVGTILILIFGVHFGILPVGGYGTDIKSHLESLILPSVAIAVAIVPVLVRSLRAALLEALNMDYVAFARAKGLRPSSVLIRYALRNASIPAVNILGVTIGFLVGQTLVIENVFALPGLGRLMIQAIFKRDFPVVQGIALVFAILTMIVLLLTDVACDLLDTRAA